MPVTTEATTKEASGPRAISRIGRPLILASVLGSVLGIVIAQVLDDFGDGLLAEILGGDAVIFNNRIEFTGATDLAWGGGFALCLIIGLFALFAYPTQRGHGIPRLTFLWMLLHVLRQALTQALMVPFDADSQLALAYSTLDAPAGLDVVVGAAGGVGLILIGLSAASGFLSFTPHRKLVSSARKRGTFVLWMVLIPAAVAAFLAIPYFLPVSSLVIRTLPFTGVIFLATLAAAPGTTSVRGPEDHRSTPWPWGLAATLVVLLGFYLGVLEGGASIDPRQWG